MPYNGWLTYSRRNAAIIAMIMLGGCAGGSLPSSAPTAESAPVSAAAAAALPALAAQTADQPTTGEAGKGGPANASPTAGSSETRRPEPQTPLSATHPAPDSSHTQQQPGTAAPSNDPMAQQAHQQPPASAATQPGASSAPGSTGSAPAASPAAPANGPVISPGLTEVQTEPTSAVQISIIGDKEKGTILEATSMEWKEGDTVLDILQRIAKEKKVQLETRGKGKTAYVEGIANLYEFDQGAKSGWLFRVNGQFASKSAGAVAVNKGDRVEWLYTLDLGRDVGKAEGAAKQ